jgi:hypothetical protein
MAYHIQLGPLPHDVGDIILSSLDGSARARVVALSKSHAFYFWSHLADKHDARALVERAAKGEVSVQRIRAITEAIHGNANLLRWCRESTEMKNWIDARRLYLPRELVSSGIFTLTYPIGYNIDPSEYGNPLVRQRLFDADSNATVAFSSILDNLRRVAFNMNDQACRAVSIAANLLGAPTFSLFAVQDELASCMRTYRPTVDILGDLEKLFDHPEFDPCAERGAWAAFLLGTEKPEIQPLFDKLVNHPRFRVDSFADQNSAKRWIAHQFAGRHFVRFFASCERDLRRWFTVDWIKLLKISTVHVHALKSLFERLTHEEHVGIALISTEYGMAGPLMPIFRALSEAVVLDQHELVQRVDKLSPTEDQRVNNVYSLYLAGFVDVETMVSTTLTLCTTNPITAFNTVKLTQYSFKRDGYDVLSPLLHVTEAKAVFNVGEFLSMLKKEQTGGFDAAAFVDQLVPVGNPRLQAMFAWLREDAKEKKKRKKKPKKKKEESPAPKKVRRNPKRTNWNEAWEEAKRKVKGDGIRGLMLEHDFGDDSGDEDFVP